MNNYQIYSVKLISNKQHEKQKEASISPEISVIEVRKSWFAKPETSPNGSPTVRVALQEPKTVTQLRFFKLR